MNKLLAIVVTALFASVSLNAMAASHAGAQGKDGKKMEKKKGSEPMTKDGKKVEKKEEKKK